MKIKELLKNTYNKKILSNNEIDSILALVLKRKVDYIYKNDNKEINILNIKKFNSLINKRLKNIPFSYIKKYKEFYNLKFLVNKNVLIPRPESELLIDLSLNFIKKNKLKDINIVDIGTGSGCLIISLSKQLKKYNSLGIDINSKSLKIAKTNARKNKVNIKFIKYNLLNNIPKQKFNIVLANLPYLNKEEMKELSIIKEPNIALYSGKEGLEYYIKLIKQNKDYLKEKYIILFEINPEQKNKLDEIIKNNLPNSRLKYIKDLSNNIRVLQITNK